MKLLRSLSLLGLAAVLAPNARAYDDDYRHGRIRHLEPGAVLQRASEASAEEAVTNLPFLPGDRVWTDGAGRVEFQFTDGSLLRLDSRSKLDYLGHDEDRSERITLRLWSGSIWLRSRDGGAADFELETPGGFVSTHEPGVFRVDVDPGTTTLSVYEGSARLEAGRRSVEVEAGERSWASRGDTPASPRRFDRRDDDDFAAWNFDLDDRGLRSAESARYLPEETQPYAAELESNGSWYFVAEVGHVWRPYVGSGWQPYNNGRWVWTRYGWTWIPAESWGWAPFHYGRWGHSHNVGWYWIPGRAWSPAWVSWAVGGDYVGWCALGMHDRPVYATREVPRYGSVVGRAVPRTTTEIASPGSWVYARRSDMTAPEVAKKRVTLAYEAAKQLKVTESPRARPSRDFKAVDVDAAVQREYAKPKTVRMGHSIGDAVPELREDNRTTIPAPVVRRPRPGTDEPRNNERETARTTAPATTAAPASPAARERDFRDSEPEVSAPRRTWERRPSPSTSTPGSSAPRSYERQPEVRRSEPEPRRTEPDRDVLRRIFSPLSGGSTAQPRQSEPRSSPPGSRVESSRPTTPPTTSAPKAVPRPKDKDRN